MHTPCNPGNEDFLELGGDVIAGVVVIDAAVVVVWVDDVAEDKTVALRSSDSTSKQMKCQQEH